MGRNTVKTVTIAAPPAQVFAVLCDVERWPEWTHTMTRISRLDSGPLKMGSSAKVRQPKLPASVWRVTDVEQNRNFTWISRSPGLLSKADHLVEPSGSGSKVTLSFEMSGLMAPLMARIYGKLIDEYVTIESQSLKKHCEASP
jgi:uncharacterized protein YndB with AHSA1/START domain